MLRRFQRKPEEKEPLSGHHSQMSGKARYEHEGADPADDGAAPARNHQAAVEDVHDLHQPAVARRAIDYRRVPGIEPDGGPDRARRLPRPPWSHWLRPGCRLLRTAAPTAARPAEAHLARHWRRPDGGSCAGPSVAWRCGSSLASSQSCQTSADPVSEIGMIRIASVSPIHLCTCSHVARSCFFPVFAIRIPCPPSPRPKRKICLATLLRTIIS